MQRKSMGENTEVIRLQCKKYGSVIESAAVGTAEFKGKCVKFESGRCLLIALSLLFAPVSMATPYIIPTLTCLTPIFSSSK